MGGVPAWAIVLDVAGGALGGSLFVALGGRRWIVYYRWRFPAFGAEWKAAPATTRQAVRLASWLGWPRNDAQLPLALAYVAVRERLARARRISRTRLVAAAVRSYWLFPLLLAVFLWWGGSFNDLLAIAVATALLVSIWPGLWSLILWRDPIGRAKRTRALLLRGTNAAKAGDVLVRARELAEPARRPARMRAALALNRESRRFRASARREALQCLAVLIVVGTGIGLGFWVDNVTNTPLSSGIPPLSDVRLPPSERDSRGIFDQLMLNLSFAIAEHDDNVRYVLAHVSPGVRMTYVLEDVDEEIGNGGFEQLYWNSDGRFVPEAAADARAIGANQYAAVLERSERIFPGAKVPSSQAVREHVLGSFGATHPFLATLDGRWRERGFEPALRRYVRAHPSQFFR